MVAFEHLRAGVGGRRDLAASQVDARYSLPGRDDLGQQLPLLDPLERVALSEVHAAIGQVFTRPLVRVEGALQPGCLAEDRLFAAGDKEGAGRGRCFVAGDVEQPGDFGFADAVADIRQRQQLIDPLPDQRCLWALPGAVDEVRFDKVWGSPQGRDHRELAVEEAGVAIDL